MTRPPHLRTLSLAIATGLTAASLCAQDTRTVTEPVIPSPCATLKAAFTSAAATSGDIEARAAKAGAQSPTLDTARIQDALDHCTQGEAVELASNASSDAFLSGPLLLRPGVTLLVDKGVTLFATRNPEFYAVSPGSCGVVNDSTSAGCKPFITVKSGSGSGIMGDGIVDGQGGAKLIVDGKPSAKSWWDLAEDARSAGHQQSPHIIDADFADDLTLYRITLRNSPNTSVAYRRGAGLTAWAIRIDTPKTARNTIGIDTGPASNITIAHSYIATGDDDVAIKAGDGPTTHVSVAHNHFYSGHGMAIGDETTSGVSGVRVEDLSLDGTESGLRIKSSATHGGHVQDITYDDICIRDSRYPITFDSVYSFPGKKVDRLPVYDDITLRNVRISGGGKLQINGFDHTNRAVITLDSVLIADNPASYHPVANHADLTFGPGPVNIRFSGDDSTLTGNFTEAKAASCSTKFVPFPR